ITPGKKYRGALSMPKVALATLGCKVNQYETQVLRERLVQAGFREVPFKEKADFYIINTCSVTQRADHKSEELIKAARKNGSNARLIVTGCYAEAEKDELRKRLPQIDLVVGNEEKLKIPHIITGPNRNFRDTELLIQTFYAHNRAFVKIEDGCNQFCSYCRVPYVRGAKIKSRPPNEVLKEVESLIFNGFKEIVLVGVNLALYGRDLDPPISLVDLLRGMQYLEKTVRVRLSSLEAHLLPSGLIDFISNCRLICAHLHLPLQSGDPEILQKMGRRYTPDQYRRLVENIKRMVPSVAITTDVMVGFPGETQRQFLNTYHFVREIGFSRLHIFRFSPRIETRAYSMQPRVEDKVKKERSNRLRELGENLAQSFASHFLGDTLRVLVEERVDPKTGLFSGYSDNYIRVSFKGKKELENKLVIIRLISVNQGQIMGEAEKVLSC
ncbi:MAG: tRNA (N(6)-L-threonylcarbamoyladenosine(37)-C(2))-methylthiotransferase MtaB, partial [bacterium]